MKYCDCSQKGTNERGSTQYGHVPPKIADQVPWQKVCVDFIGPSTIKGLDGKIMDFMCLTIIDPATGWFEIVELTTILRMEKNMIKLLKSG